ncbi:hypothetical protein [Ornithinibacillus xuwenensis]|uniref:Type II secretory pathway, pseudopilin PulG n=1 Tax=Ornithinibacillus xuwenensis TaxID=3144668 RepID=A0ABU9XBC4_9BACI
MMNSNKESGATLVMTLLMITLVLLFILTLFYQILNTTKQITLTEKKLIAEQIAAMGIDYYHAYVEETMPEAFSDSNEVVLPDIPLQEKILLDNSGDFSFWIKQHSLHHVSESEMEIDFTSVGEALGEVTEVDSSITITIESGD